MKNYIGFHCSAAISLTKPAVYAYCLHGFRCNKGCRNYSVEVCTHGEHLTTQPPCLDEESPVPEWNLVKRLRERLERLERGEL